MNRATGESDMSCGELVELVTDYLEDALSDADRARFQTHLADCPGCSRYLEQMRLIPRLAGRLADDAVPAETHERLLEVFRDWKRSR